MFKRLALLFVFALVGSSAYAADCQWKYKIVNLESPDALYKMASSKETARSGLEKALDKLGKKDWELASQHSILEIEEADYVANPKADPNWVYLLDPPVAMFKKRVCVE